MKRKETSQPLQSSVSVFRVRYRIFKTAHEAELNFCRIVSKKRVPGKSHLNLHVNLREKPLRERRKLIVRKAV